MFRCWGREPNVQEEKVKEKEGIVDGTRPKTQCTGELQKGGGLLEEAWGVRFVWVQSLEGETARKWIAGKLSAIIYH